MKIMQEIDNAVYAKISNFETDQWRQRSLIVLCLSLLYKHSTMSLVQTLNTVSCTNIQHYLLYKHSTLSLVQTFSTVSCTNIQHCLLYKQSTLSLVQTINTVENEYHPRNSIVTNEPRHEIMVLPVLRKPSFQTRMRSHPVGLDVCILVGPFVYFYVSCVRTMKTVTD